MPSRRRKRPEMPDKLPGYKISAFDVMSGHLASIKHACYDPDYALYEVYGARGIGICDKWRVHGVGIYDFIEDVGLPPKKGMVLTLIDRDKDFKPGNCRWVEMKDVVRFKRNAKLYRVNGKMMGLGEMASLSGLSINTISDRLSSGWSPEEAMRTEARSREVHQVLYEGQQRTLAELSALVGLPIKLLYDRIVIRGWDVDRAISQPKRKISKKSTARTFLYKGEQKTVSELAALAGISVGTMHRRLFRFNYTPEEAVSLPAIKGQKRIPAKVEPPGPDVVNVFDRKDYKPAEIKRFCLINPDAVIH